MLTDLGKQIDSGKTDDAIIAYFVDKYGPTVLAAPPASGFNLAAWVMPFAALGIGTLVAVYFLRRFRMRSAGAAGAIETNQDLGKYQDKVEEELKKFTPED
jgi:cytochrome c-type biogenesis protein CcmH